MTTNRTRAEQIVMAMVSKNPPLWVDLIEQALDEAEKDGYQKATYDVCKTFSKGLHAGTLAGLEMAAKLCDEGPNGACPECASDIRAKAKELAGKLITSEIK